MNIQFFPRDVDGPGCYRCLYPADQLARQGGHVARLGRHEVLQESEKFKAIRWILDVNDFSPGDVAVFAMPLYREFCVFQEALQRIGVRVVVELDDDYFNLPEWNPARKNLYGGDSNYHIRNLIWSLRHCDGVTVSTPALRDSIEKVTDRPVFVLRNFLDWRCWTRVPPVCESKGWSRFRVGYLGLGQWHSGDLMILTPWMGEWLRDNPEVEFVAIDPSVHDIIGVPEGQRVTVDSFAFRHQEIADYAATMDVGLVPLQNHPFNEAKSHLKGMEYAGCGIPSVCSPTESYREWWLAGPDGVHGGAGFLADGPGEWVHALDCLASDGELLRRMGRRARVVASENTYQQHWRLWERAYEDILGVDRSSRPVLTKQGQTTNSLGVIIAN